MHSMCTISVYFCIVIYNKSWLHVCKHGRYVCVQGMPMCPNYGDTWVRASVCQRPSGQQAQSLVVPQLMVAQRGCGEEGCGLLPPLPPMLSRERISAEYVCGPWVPGVSPPRSTPLGWRWERGRQYKEGRFERKERD